jgi:hypothetical protein
VSPRALNLGSVDDPDAVRWFADYLTARQRQA